MESHALHNVHHVYMNILMVSSLIHLGESYLNDNINIEHIVVRKCCHLDQILYSRPNALENIHENRITSSKLWQQSFLFVLVYIQWT